MRQVAIITKEQKDKLIGQQFMTDVYYNPIQDLDDNWVISSEEIDQSEDREIISFKDLKLNTHRAKKVLTEEPPEGTTKRRTTKRGTTKRRTTKRGTTKRRTTKRGTTKRGTTKKKIMEEYNL
jgi:hypothetical protein